MIDKRTGFTLIELLVVMAIIGLLAGIVVPVLQKAFLVGDRTRAMSEVRDLDGAIKRYFTEYGKMPVPAGYNGKEAHEAETYVGDVQAAIVEALVNPDSSLNPKKIVFLDIDPSSFKDDEGKSLKTTVEMLQRLSTGKPYQDPWGTDYGILLDLNFDGKISSADFGVIRTKTAVYSAGEHLNKTNPPFKTW